MGNFSYYDFYQCVLSEPQKYLGTHVLFAVGMLLYYVFCARIVALVVVTILFHVSVLLCLVVLAFRDPGVLPSVLPGSEGPEFSAIPFDSLICRTEKRYVFTQKTHFLRLKFCN
jgi:hypothetical protein